MSTYFHGEITIFKKSALPKGLKQIGKFKGDCYKLADSEQTGNHHLLEAKDGVKLFEDATGVLWLKNDVPVDVYCAVKERHDNITLEPGVWEIDRAQEYDYLTDMKRAVVD